jgi:hypothetical protein
LCSVRKVLVSFLRNQSRLRRIGNKKHVAVEWIRLSAVKVRWKGHVNTVMRLRLPYKLQNFLIGNVTVQHLKRTLLRVGSFVS